jgi:hypothetical protein
MDRTTTNPEEHLYAILETFGYNQALEVLTTKYKSLAAKKGTKVINNLKVMGGCQNGQNSLDLDLDQNKHRKNLE